jgi:hypothetical protein
MPNRRWNMRSWTPATSVVCIALAFALASCDGSGGGGGETEEAEVDTRPQSQSAETSTEPAAVVHFDVRIGSDFRAVMSHDITSTALQSGRTQFSVADGDKKYRVELTAAQIQDLLAGSTIMLEGRQADGEGIEPVRLSMHEHAEDAGEEDAGW